MLQLYKFFHLIKLSLDLCLSISFFKLRSALRTLIYSFLDFYLQQSLSFDLIALRKGTLGDDGLFLVLFTY